MSRCPGFWMSSDEHACVLRSRLQRLGDWSVRELLGMSPVLVMLLASHLQAQVVPEEVRFESTDGVTVFGDLYRASPGDAAPVVLLLHQSAASTAEYRTVAPALLERGYHVLAVDARGGGEGNRTVARLPDHGGGREAYHDFKAALVHIRDLGFTGPIGIVGSSYSAGRIFQVLAEKPEGVMAVAAFSPGAAFARRTPEGGPSWAEQVEIPVLMSWAPHELDEDRRGRFERVASERKVLYEQERGVHGASTLVPDRNPEGWEANLEALLAFLERHLGSGTTRGQSRDDEGQV